MAGPPLEAIDKISNKNAKKKVTEMKERDRKGGIDPTAYDVFMGLDVDKRNMSVRIEVGGIAIANGRKRGKRSREKGQSLIIDKTFRLKLRATVP
jgi:hypothetical protein